MEAKFLNNITKCITFIGNSELQFRPTVIIDTQYVNNKTKGNRFRGKLAKKLMRNGIPSLTVAEGLISKLQDISFNTLVVTYFENCDDINNLDFSNIDKDIKQLMVTFESTSNNCIDKLQEIKNSVDKYDITFMLLNIRDDINKFYTFIPKMDANTCEVVVERYYHINTCANGFMQSNEVFPEKEPINLNKCPLKIGLAALQPFSQINDYKSLKTYDHINTTKGFDVDILNIFANYFNATLDLFYIYRKEENPYVNTDFINFIINGSLDICAGGLYRMYGDAVAYSGLYARQAILWIYAVKRDERSWATLLDDMHDIYMFFVFYASYSISWYLICKFDGDPVSFIDTLLYGWGALVGGTALKEVTSLKQKILNLGLFIMRIYLSAYISIHLYSFLTIKEPPDMFITDDELMDSGRVAFLETSTKYFVDDERYLEFGNTTVECVSFKDCIEKTLQQNGMTMVLQGNFFQFQSDTAINGEARMMKLPEHVLTVYNEMLIRKDSPLVDDLQKLLQNLFEAGITEALYKKAIGLLVMEKSTRAHSNMLSHSYSCQSGCTITVEQFAVIFYAYSFGCILSCVVFALELYSRGRHVLI
ncbi:unnamed protein product [Arctia plantaginis]|uniref:Ionotropic receptor n=1 Tax=Arctia plantaginis TaxID=874455 RepID=A0A8S0ZAR5_ARCPL|nr:unnamed protein product [Arctia plantaginis]